MNTPTHVERCSLLLAVLENGKQCIQCTLVARALLSNASCFRTAQMVIKNIFSLFFWQRISADITSEATLSAYLIEGIAPSAQSVHRASFAYRSHYRHTCIHPGGCRTIGQCDHWILALRPWTGTPGSQTPAQ